MVAERTAMRADWRELAARRCEAYTYSGDQCREWGLDVDMVGGRLLCRRHRRAQADNKIGAFVPRRGDLSGDGVSAPEMAKAGAIADETPVDTAAAPIGPDSGAQAPLRPKAPTYWDRLRARGVERRVERAIPAGLRERPALAPTERPKTEVFAEIADRDDAMRAEYKATGPTPWPDAFARLTRAGEEAREQRRMAAEAAAPAQRSRRSATADDVIRIVADVFNLRASDLISKSRDWDIAHPRQLAMVLMRQVVPSISYAGIGKALGGRDHTTILYGVEKVERLLAEGDNDTVRGMHDIRQALRDEGFDG